MKIGSGEFDIAETWGSEFAEVFRVACGSEEARVFFADNGSSEVIVTKVREERPVPVLRLEEVAVGTAEGFVNIESFFLRKRKGVFISSLVSIERRIEGSEVWGFQELNERAEDEVCKLAVILESLRWELVLVAGFADSRRELGFVLEVHFMGLEERLADLCKEILGTSVLKEAAFPSEDFSSVR